MLIAVKVEKVIEKLLVWSSNVAPFGQLNFILIITSVCMRVSSVMEIKNNGLVFIIFIKRMK